MLYPLNHSMITRQNYNMKRLKTTTNTYFRAPLLTSIAIIILQSLSSCAKEEGEGGLAKIHGKVYAYNLNKLQQVADSGYIGAHKVYISYGDHITVDDEVVTSYDGSYAFRELYKGDYAVFTYSYCDGCALNQEVFIQKVKISSVRESVELKDFKVTKE